MGLRSEGGKHDGFRLNRDCQTARPGGTAVAIVVRGWQRLAQCRYTKRSPGSPNILPGRRLGNAASCPAGCLVPPSPTTGDHNAFTMR